MIMIPTHNLVQCSLVGFFLFVSGTAAAANHSVCSPNVHFFFQSVEVTWKLKSKPKTCFHMHSLGTTTTRGVLTVSGWSQQKKATAWSSSFRPLKLRRRQIVAMTTWSCSMELTPNLHGLDVTVALGWEYFIARRFKSWETEPPWRFFFP